MKTGRQLHPIFRRYILIFLLFSLILMVFIIPLYRSIVDFTFNNEMKFIQDKLNYGVSVLDSTIVTLNNAVITTSRDSRFRIFRYSSPAENYNPYVLRELQENLNNLLLSQSLIADGGIIFSEKNVLTRQRVFYSTEQYTFYGQFLSCENFSFDEWIYKLKSERPFASLSEYRSADFGSYEAITFSATWAAVDYPEEITLFATIPVKLLIVLLIDNDVAEQGYIKISDIQGNTLFSSSQKADNYHSVRIQSNVTSLAFEIGAQKSLITQKMTPITNWLKLFLVIMGTITVSLSLIFAWKTSKPVMITDAKLNASLQTIEQQAELLKIQLFDMALQKGIYTPEELRQFQAVFTVFPEKFQLADIRYQLSDSFDFETTLAAQVKLINLVNEFIEQKQLGNIYVQAREGNIIILLLPLFLGNESWYEHLSSLRNELNHQTEFTLGFALSDVFSRPSDLSRAWQQLRYINILRRSDYSTTVKQVGDIQGDSIQLPLNLAMLEMIYNSLGNADEYTACSILSECTSAISKETRQPDSRIELIAEIILNRLSNMIMQLKLENPTVLFDIDIPVFVPLSWQDLFEKQYPQCFRLIGEKFRNQSQHNISKFGQKILDYIKDNLYDSGLYITMVSDHFNISAPTLQKLIKTISGETFLVYVESQRLIKAREMLASGTYTVQEVATQCGFSKTDSFYKAFKRTYGFPPSKAINKAILK